MGYIPNQDEIVIKGGDSYTVEKWVYLWGSEGDVHEGSATVNNVHVDGGTLSVGSSEKFGAVEGGTFRMTDGEVTVGGKADDSNWNNTNSYITGGWGNPVAVSLTGGIVNLADGGRIQTTRQSGDGAVPVKFHIGGSAVINMTGADGKESVLRANGSYLQENSGDISDGKGYHAKMFMSGGTINVTGHGAILSRETTMSDGLIDVKNNGRLTVAGSASDSSSDVVADMATTNGKIVKKWGTFNINGGTIANSGVIDFVTGDMTLNATGGTHTGNMYIQNTIGTTPTAGTYSKNLNVSGGMFTVEGNLAVGNNGVLNNTNGSLDVTGTAMLGGTSNLGGTNRFRGDSKMSGNLTMAANSTLQLDSKMEVSGHLKLASSTKLIWKGTGREVITNSGTITMSDSSDLGAYLAGQSVSNLAQKTIFSRDTRNNIFADITKISSSGAAAQMTNILNQTGAGHMTSGLSPQMAATWSGIMSNSANANAAVTDVLNHLDTNTSSGEAQSIVSTLAGFDSAKSLDISMATANSITGRINSRVADNNLARAQSSGSGFSSRGAFAAPRYGHNVNAFANRFWMGGFGLWEDADKRGFDNGYKYQSGGIIAGYDRVIGDFTAGASYAYTQGDYEDKNALDSNSEIASYALTLYGTYNHATGLFATGMFGYTYSDYDLDNLVTRNGDWDKSSFHANTFTLGGNIGYDIRPTETFSITPSLGLYYYTSASNTFNTSIRHNMRVEQDSFEMPIDVSVNYDIPAGGDSVVRLTANGGYSHDFSWDGGDLDGFGYNGVAGSRISGIKGREVARHTWNVGAGAKYTSGALDVGVKYDYYTKSDYDAHRVMGTVGMSF